MQAPDLHVPRWFRDRILSRLKVEPLAFGIDGWIGLGRFYSLLSNRDEQSVVFVPRILESRSNDIGTISAAFWAGYLWAPSVSSQALRRLRGAYRANAITVQTEELFEEDLRRKFFHHLMIGTLREIEGFDEMLLDTLSEEYLPTTRESVAFALGRAVQEASGDEADELFRTRATKWFELYWKQHVLGPGGADGDALSTYLRWLEVLRSDPAEIEELVVASLRRSNHSFEIGTVVEYVGRQADIAPLVALRILSECVDWYRLHGDFWLSRDEVRNTLDKIATLTRSERLLRDVLDGFVELGALSTEDVRRYLG